MKRHTALVLTIVSSIVVTLLSLQVWQSQTGGSEQQRTCRLRVVPETQFAEVFEETTHIPYEFTIHNDGSAPVTIKAIKTSCSCTVASFVEQEIPPQGCIKPDAELDATITLPRSYPCIFATLERTAADTAVQGHADR